MARIVCISDTHCQLSKMVIPDADILIHAGDLTFQGTIQEISKELKDLASLPHKVKILICGNHDWIGQNNPSLMEQMCKDKNIILLNHNATTINNIKFFGSPYTPAFCNWAFNVDRAELHNYWEDIPADTQVLITHGPPAGILDETPRGEAVGCTDLWIKTQNLPDLQYHIYGHIHNGYGTQKVGNITYINASSCTEQYKPTNDPIIIYV